MNEKEVKELIEKAHQRLEIESRLFPDRGNMQEGNSSNRWKRVRLQGDSANLNRFEGDKNAQQ